MLTLAPMPDPSTVGGTYLDNNFWQITEKTAIKLCEPYGLPRHGYYRVISFQGCKCEVHRTITGALQGERRQVWAIMVTSTPLQP